MKKKICLSLVLVSMLNAQDTQNVMLEDITVTATKIEDKISKVPLSISVIDEKKFLKEGTTSLYDTLANEVGVSVSGGEGRSQNITIRGISGNRIKIIKDGVPISDGYGANNLNDVVGANTFDLSDVKKIEVLKGSNSALQGSGSLGGTVIVHTKQLDDYLKNDDLYASTTSKYDGQSDKLQQNFMLAKRIDDLQIGLRGNYSKSDETQNFESNVYKRDIESGTVEFLQAYAFETFYMNNSLEIYNEEAKRNDGIAPRQEDGGGWEAKSFYEKKETKNINFTSDFEFDLDSNYASELDLKLYYRKTEFTENRNVLMHKNVNNILIKRLQVDDNTYENNILGTNIEAAKYIGNHNIKYGFNFQHSLHNRPRNKTITELGVEKFTLKEPFAKTNTLKGSAFVTDKFDINDLNVTFALRYDYQKLSAKESKDNLSDKISNHISPSFALSYALNNDLNVYSSYNYGFNAPGADKVYANVPHLFGNFLSDFILVPNLDLKEEKSHNVELGTKYKSDKSYFHFAVFHNWYKDFIEPINVALDTQNKHAIKKYVNIDRVRTYGFETSFEYQVDKSLKLSTSLGVVDGKDNDKKRISNLTPFEGNIRADYNWKNLDIYSRVNYASSMGRTPVCHNDIGVVQKCATTSGWATLDAGASYKINKKISFSVAAYNLLNKRYTKYQDVKGRTEDLTEFDARASRYFNANLKVEF